MSVLSYVWSPLNTKLEHKVFFICEDVFQWYSFLARVCECASLHQTSFITSETASNEPVLPKSVHDMFLWYQGLCLFCHTSSVTQECPLSFMLLLRAYFLQFLSSNWNYKQCWTFFCYKGFENFRKGTFSGTAALFESVSRQRITEPKRAHHSESISQNHTMPELTQSQSCIVLWTSWPWMLGNHVESTAILTVSCYCDLVQLELTVAHLTKKKEVKSIFFSKTQQEIQFLFYFKSFCFFKWTQLLHIFKNGSCDYIDMGEYENNLRLLTF